MPFNIGDRVLARIPSTGLIPDPDRLLAPGTVVEKPGGLVYNVRLDEPVVAPRRDAVRRHHRPRRGLPAPSGVRGHTVRSRV